MTKNNPVRQYIQSPLLYLVISAGYAATIIALDEWLKISIEKVISGFAFLTGTYLLFYFLFLFIQKKRNDQSAFIFLILTGLKFALIISYLFLFLKPTSIENKTEILLFLMNYFALLIVDMVVKMRLIR